jgi:hypothetical protein
LVFELILVQAAGISLYGSSAKYLTTGVQELITNQSSLLAWVWKVPCRQCKLVMSLAVETAFISTIT